MSGFKFPTLKMNLRSMISMHEARERFDVALTVGLPLFLMLVSSWTNAWAITGGHLSFSSPDLVNTIFAIVKGLFIEALVFCFFKLVKILCSLGRWNCLAALVPFMCGLFAVVVSSGCGIAWAVKSGDMNFMIDAVSSNISPTVSTVFKAGVGMLFPVSLGVLAVYDALHMITDHIRSGSQLKTLALRVEHAEHHQGMLRQAQQDANNDPKIKESYSLMAQANAQQALDYAKNNDYSFGLASLTQELAPAPQPSAIRVTPMTAYPTQMIGGPGASGTPGFPPPALGGPAGLPGTPGMPGMSGPMTPQPPYMNAQTVVNPPFSNTTIPLSVPPLPMQPQMQPQKKGLGEQLKNWAMAKNG